DRPPRHLTGDRDHGDRVHVRARETGDQVRHAGAARRDADAGLSGRLRVAVGRVRGALLVSAQDVADRRVEDRVVEGQDRAAGDAEHHLDTFLLETLDRCLRSGDLHLRSSLDAALSAARWISWITSFAVATRTPIPSR